MRPSSELLKVKLIKEKIKKPVYKVNEGLPQPPFFLGVIAPRKSGKTNCVIDLLTDVKKLRYIFDVVIVWSSTYFLDGKWKNIELPEGSIFTEFREKDAEILLAVAEKVNAENPKPAPILFVFDDMVTEGIMNPRVMKTLDKFALKGRHSHVSSIVISQQFGALSPPVRNNTTNIIFFRIRNGYELDKISHENSEFLTQRGFRDMLDYATKEPYSFLHVNNQESDPSKRYHLKWYGVLSGFETHNDQKEKDSTESGKSDGKGKKVPTAQGGLQSPGDGPK